MDPILYFEKFYRIQDHVLHLINALTTDFYLTGGTALSRGYLHHRFSDDLDLFVNDDDRFGIWAKEVIEALQADVNQSVKVLRQEERFARLMVTVGDLPLRIEMVNDVPAHIGEIITHNVLGRLDSAETSSTIKSQERSIATSQRISQTSGGYAARCLCH